MSNLISFGKDFCNDAERGGSRAGISGDHLPKPTKITLFTIIYAIRQTAFTNFENLWGLYLSGGPLPVCSLGCLPAKPGVVVESEDDDVSAKVEIEEEVVDETAAVVAT